MTQDSSSRPAWLTPLLWVAALALSFAFLFSGTVAVLLGIVGIPMSLVGLAAWVIRADRRGGALRMTQLGFGVTRPQGWDVSFQRNDGSDVVIVESDRDILRFRRSVAEAEKTPGDFVQSVRLANADQGNELKGEKPLQIEVAGVALEGFEAKVRTRGGSGVLRVAAGIAPDGHLVSLFATRDRQTNAGEIDRLVASLSYEAYEPGAVVGELREVIDQEIEFGELDARGALQGCRERFEQAKRDRPAILRANPWKGVDAGDDMMRVFREQEALFEHGEVVWGRVWRAGSQAWKPSPHNIAASVVYGFGSDFERDPGALLPVASGLQSAVYSPEDLSDEVEAFAARFRDEMASFMGVQLPQELTGGAKILSSSLALPRELLPYGYLPRGTGLLPIVIAPEHAFGPLPLSWQCWDPALVERWHAAHVLTQMAS